MSTSVANLVLPVPHQAHSFLRAPLCGGEALRAARAPGKLALSWWSDQQRERPPAGAGSGERARAACVGLREAAVGALRPSGPAGSTGSRRACWTWTCSRCWRPRGRAPSSLVTARCKAVQRDGWQQQQRGSGGGGGEEQEKQRSRADAGRKAIEGERSSPARSSPSQRAQSKADVVAFKTVALSEFEDHHWSRTKRDNCSGTNWPNLKVGRHSL